MSRVSIKTKDDLPAELQPLWDKMTTYGAFENQAGVMAHRPPIFKHTWSLLVDLAESGTLSKRHLEIALVAVSLLNKCDYCVSHHAPKLAIQGVSEEGAERLLCVFNFSEKAASLPVPARLGDLNPVPFPGALGELEKDRITLAPLDYFIGRFV